MRLVLADDAVLLREGLVRLLTEQGHDVVAVVGDGPSLIAAAAEHQPDLSIVDVRMPPTHTDEGLRAAVTIRAERPGAPLVVLLLRVAAADARRRGRAKATRAAMHVVTAAVCVVVFARRSPTSR